MLKATHRYKSTDLVREIADDDISFLLVLNRFKVPFGFGNSTVAEICEANGLHTDTFLAVANLIAGLPYSGYEIHLPTLVGYLREAHSYILDFRLPDIRRTLVEAVHQPRLDSAALHIVNFFDEYVREVRQHMDHEDKVVFPHIEALLRGEAPDKFRIADFASNHDSVVTQLNELKDIFMQHYSLPNTRMLNRALFNITACGRDLISHCEVENELLVPAAEELEASVLANGKGRKSADLAPKSATRRGETLTERETEIIRLVAHGLANKEIADKLCLSFHTITTYRKNLAAKLNIHSQAALVIYAILNGIVDPTEVDLH